MENNMDMTSYEKKKQNTKPFTLYVLTWLGLLVLTGVTVTVAGLNLGAFSVLGAIVIAAAKSTLVVLLFMNIRYEDRVFKIMLGLAIFTMTAIMILTFVDTAFR